MVLWALILCGFLGQTEVVSNPEGLALVSSCGQCLGAGTIACWAPAGKGRAGKNLLYCHGHAKKCVYFKRFESRKIYAELENNNNAKSNLRKIAFCGAGRSVFACQIMLNVTTWE